MKSGLIILLSLLTLFVLPACPPDDDDDNDDATPTDDDTTDDDTVDDDTTDDDDSTDDDSIDDDTTDDDTGDDDSSPDDDTTDDDTTDDDTGDDDSADDDTTDDDTGDDDIIVSDNEYIFGGATYPFDLAATNDGPAIISAMIGGRTYLFTLDEQEILTEELWETVSPIDLKIDPAGNLHLLANEEGSSELHHLWRIDGVWHEEPIPGSTNNEISEMAIDGNGAVHLCLGTWHLKYFTNSSGEWTEETVIDMTSDPAMFCRLAATPDGSVYLSFLENWCNPSGHCFYNIHLMSNVGGDWESWLLTSDGYLNGANLAIDEAGHVDVAYVDGNQLSYGHWDGVDWTFEALPDAAYANDGIWRIGETPTIISKVGWDNELFQFTRNDGEWTTTPLGVATSYLTEFAPNDAGQWRVAYRDSDSNGLYFLDNLAGDWNVETVFLEPLVIGPLSSGMDEQGRPFILAPTNQGPQLATQTEDGWSIEPLDIGVSELRNLQMLVDNQGITHLVGYDDPNLVYVHNRNGDWQNERVEVDDAYNHVFLLLSNGEPAVAYHHNNALSFAWREDGNWTIEAVYGDWVDYHSYGIAANADDEVFICFNSETDSGIRCARRQDGQWTIDALETGLRSALATSALAIDANGAPHYVYSSRSSQGEYQIKLAVFENGEWNITIIGDSAISDAGLIIDDQGHHHLAVAHDDNDYLSYGTDAPGYWTFYDFAYTYYNNYNALQPTLLTDGTVQIPYRRDGALWRAVVAPPIP